ncbi:uncharacterized protein [Argopecten irradians]|uniref:uncharacterized protein n=1 Tax=Argopecten irradians TaxID=31199 RepID=UPI00371A2E15
MPSKKEIDDTLKKHKVVVYSKSYCPYCKNAKKALSDLGITYEAIELDQKPDGESTQGILKTMTGASSVPRVFINGKFFGGGDDTVAGAKNGKIMSLLKA